MCDSTYTGKWKLLPWNGLLYIFFRVLLELGRKVDTYVCHFLYAACFWRVTPSVFHLSWFCHVNNSSKPIIRSFYKPGFLDQIEQNILALAVGLNWLFPMNPQHYRLWLNYNSTWRPPSWKKKKNRVYLVEEHIAWSLLLPGHNRAYSVSKIQQQLWQSGESVYVQFMNTDCCHILSTCTCIRLWSPFKLYGWLYRCSYLPAWKGTRWILRLDEHKAKTKVTGLSSLYIPEKYPLDMPDSL